MLDSTRFTLSGLRGECPVSAAILCCCLIMPVHSESQSLQIAAYSASETTTQHPIYIGLDADMSKGAAQGGEAIRRGLILAIEEINGEGGVLGRPLELLVKDHRGIPARGIDNIEDFAQIRDLVAVVGGIHTPVALAELPSIHEHELIYLDPWAAGTPIVENGYQPNYVFRVSVRDEFAGGFFVGEAERRGFKKIGLLLWRTGWGRSNEKAVREALRRKSLPVPVVQWFNTGQKDLAEPILALKKAGAEVVILVASPTDGLGVIQAMASLGEEQRLPIISHWGITGGDFYQWARAELEEIDLSFLQTYSFLAPTDNAMNDSVLRSYCTRFAVCKAHELPSPVGTAHAFDLMHLLRIAIEEAGSVDRVAVRDALENIREYDGLVRTYSPPFTQSRHDALDASDFRLSHYSTDGSIVPLDFQ